MPKSVHDVLSAGVVAEVVLDNHGGAVEVVNRSYAAIPGSTIWVRFDGHDPEVEGEDSFVVIGSRRYDVWSGLGIPPTKPVTVRLLSSAAAAYSIEGGGF